MASKDDIISLPHDSLRTRSKKVGYISDEILQVIEDMKVSTLDWEASRKHEVAVALAAVQINQLHRIVIIRENCDDRENKEFTVLINPEIVKYEGEIRTDYEGCLSVRHTYGLVPRHNRVKVKAIGMDGKEIRVTAEGFMAMTLQHEIDHTNGILYIDRIKDTKDAFYHLDDEGHLQPLDYEKVSQDSILWQ
jgi:peptide deformylase